MAQFEVADSDPELGPPRLLVDVVGRDDPLAYSVNEHGERVFTALSLLTVREMYGGSLVGQATFPLTGETFPVDLSHLADADPEETFVVIRFEQTPIIGTC
ncbi:MAG TPA: hypothetical protein VF230_17080 [Acidimicrobiales bacterium]